MLGRTQYRGNSRPGQLDARPEESCMRCGRPPSARRRMDVVPVVLGSDKRYFGSVQAQHLLEDPDVVIQGDRVLHPRYPVRR